MIEEQKSDIDKTSICKNVKFLAIKIGNHNEKNVNFEDAMSMKSHRSVERYSNEYDAISMKSMK